MTRALVSIAFMPAMPNRRCRMHGGSSPEHLRETRTRSNMGGTRQKLLRGAAKFQDYCLP
jgi:hypothetical protein